MTDGYVHSFSALRGIQGKREYYIAMVPLKLLPKIFLFDEKELPAEMRAQRGLNRARIPEIARYVLDNREDYVFSALTASIDGEVRFTPVSQGVTPVSQGGAPAQNGSGEICAGILEAPATARFIINDGQHRRAGIEAALKKLPELGDETIGVVFFMDNGLRRAQQLFADLNKHAVHPTGSLGILYDFRDPLACLVRDLSEEIPAFQGLTEKERTSITSRSTKLFTLGGIYNATAALLGKSKHSRLSDEEEKTARLYWNELSRTIPEWQLAAKRILSIRDLRKEYVCTNNLLLHALGIAGCHLVRSYPEDWLMRLEPLRRVDWKVTNRMWEGRAVLRGKMNKGRQSLQLTAIKLRSILGLPLSDDEAWLV